jgi:hypothetical protein
MNYTKIIPWSAAAALGSALAVGIVSQLNFRPNHPPRVRLEGLDAFVYDPDGNLSRAEVWSFDKKIGEYNFQRGDNQKEITLDLRPCSILGGIPTKVKVYDSKGACAEDEATAVDLFFLS